MLQGRSSTHANQGNDDIIPKPSDGRSTADGLACGAVLGLLRFGTWNVLSMRLAKLQVVESEMTRCNLDILDKTELKWTDSGDFCTGSGPSVSYSGHVNLRKNGVIAKATAKCVIGYNTVDDRIMTIRLKAKPRNITLAQAYASTSEADADIAIQ